MNDDLATLIEESMNLELNVSDIYSLFNNLFPDDAEFWWILVFEENSHAAIIQSGKEYFKLSNKFPHKLLHNSLQTIKETNSWLLSLIKKFNNCPPSREEAFNIALKIENSAGELNFQQFMDEEDTKANSVFKLLNKYNKKHIDVIRSYMKKHGISLHSGNG